MSILEEAKRVLFVESECIKDQIEKLDDQFVKAVEKIVECKGKLIVTGMGKSGQVARKISSTFSSTGTPSLFLSPAEGLHGDLGVIESHDLVLAISYGGEAEEMVPLIEYVKRKNIVLISLTGFPKSTLGRESTFTLDINVKQEACPLGLAPTSSSTVTLAMGDALSMAALKLRGFEKEDFAQFHPGGKLGRQLLTRVSDIMHTGESLAVVGLEEELTEAIMLMTSKSVQGIAGVVNAEGSLVGVITDGNIRRCLEQKSDPYTLKAESVMTLNPKTIDCDEVAVKALFLMEQFQIQSLLVTDKSSTQPQRPKGVLHLHDLLKTKLK